MGLQFSLQAFNITFLCKPVDGYMTYLVGIIGGRHMKEFCESSLLTIWENNFKSVLELKDFYKVSSLILIVSDKIILESVITESLILKEVGRVE